LLVRPAVVACLRGRQVPWARWLRPLPAATGPEHHVCGARDYRDDRGSMPIALMITLVGLTLSGMLSTMVVSQIQATRTTGDRVQSIHAAQAGLDLALAKIRDAYDAVGGNRTMLPCGPLNRTVDPALPTDSARFEVTIGYYRVDPSGYQNNLAAIASSKIACTAGTASVPAYALIQSRGTGGGDRNHDAITDADAGPWRTLYATYTFSTKDENLPGGTIDLAGSAYCLGSPVANPVAGTPVRITGCTPGTANTFIYPKNLTLVLSRTRTGALPRGLCVTAGSQTDGAAVTFQPCAAVTDPQQQWEHYTGPFSYMGTADGKTRSLFCLNVEPAGALNASVVMRGGTSCDDGTHSSNKSFFPNSLVGPGAAGADTGQLVNKREVGRCMDLPRDDVTGALAYGAKKPSLITFPCKQAFDGNVHWNHKWKLPTFAPGEFTATGRISITPTYTPPEAPDPEDGVEHCMKSDGPGGGNVWVVKCSTGGAALNWTLYSRAPLIEDAFQITDTYGNCLQSVGPTAPAAQKLDFWSFVVTAPCDGSDLQKWNVPTSWTNAPLKELGEK
jgi:hypothetical protein